MRHRHFHPRWRWSMPACPLLLSLDTMAADDNSDMFNAMRITMGIERAGRRDGEVLPAQQVLRPGHVRGRRAIPRTLRRGRPAPRGLARRRDPASRGRPQHGAAQRPRRPGRAPPHSRRTSTPCSSTVCCESATGRWIGGRHACAGTRRHPGRRSAQGASRRAVRLIHTSTTDRPQSQPQPETRVAAPRPRRGRDTRPGDRSARR